MQAVRNQREVVENRAYEYKQSAERPAPYPGQLISSMAQRAANQPGSNVPPSTNPDQAYDPRQIPMFIKQSSVPINSVANNLDLTNGDYQAKTLANARSQASAQPNQQVSASQISVAEDSVAMKEIGRAGLLIHSQDQWKQDYMNVRDNMPQKA